MRTYIPDIFSSFFVVPTSVITGNYYDEMLPMNLNRAWAKAAQETVSLLSAQQVIVNDADHKMLYLRYFISPLIAYQRFSRGILFRVKPSSDPNGPTLNGSWVEPIQHIQIRCQFFQAGWLHTRFKKNYQAGKKDGAAPKNGCHLIIKRIKFHITDCIHHSMKWNCDQSKEWLRNP